MLQLDSSETFSSVRISTSISVNIFIFVPQPPSVLKPSPTDASTNNDHLSAQVYRIILYLFIPRMNQRIFFSKEEKDNVFFGWPSRGWYQCVSRKKSEVLKTGPKGWLDSSKGAAIPKLEKLHQKTNFLFCVNPVTPP